MCQEFVLPASLEQAGVLSLSSSASLPGERVLVNLRDRGKEWKVGGLCGKERETFPSGITNTHESAPRQPTQCLSVNYLLVPFKML